MAELLLTREEGERRLEKGLLGKMIQFNTIRDIVVVGKLQKISLTVVDNEVMVIFQLLVDSLIRYECDLQYFSENVTILYGNSYTGNKSNIRRILEEDQ